MAKREKTKEGDVFCVEIGNNIKRYFQYITKDAEQLNGDVICAFKTQYSFDEEPSIAEIIDDEIEFYAHTFLPWGIKAKTWYKVGSSERKHNIDNVYFKCNDDDPSKELPQKWYIWKANKPSKRIGMITPELFEEIEWGLVFPYSDILQRLTNGCYNGVFGEKTLEGYRIKKCTKLNTL